MNLAQLRYFVAVAQMEHYGRAAKALYLTQPALSNSIRRLEKELGFPLFKSEGRNVALTSEGKVLLEHVVDSLERLDSGLDAARRCHEEKGCIVRVGSVASLLRGPLSSFLSGHCRGECRGVEFEISLHGSTKELLLKLFDNTFDVVFCGYPVGEPTLDWVPLFRQDAVVIVHESHPLADREMLSIDDIRPYPQLSYRPPSYMYYAFENMFKEKGLSPKLVFDDDVSALSVMAVSPDSVGIAIDSARDCLWESIRMIPIEEFLEPYHYVGMAFRSNVELAPVVASFVESVKRYSRENITEESIERRYYH